MDMYAKIKSLKNDLQQELDHIASQISAIGTDLDCLEERYEKLDDLLSFIEEWEEVERHYCLRSKLDKFKKE